MSSETDKTLIRWGSGERRVYRMASPVINKLLTPYNFTNKDNTGRIRYIVIHYVGALGGAKANCQYYASQYIGASAHYYVGFDGEICQSVEDGDIAWHCGASSYKHGECRNSNSIGIEMCVRNKGSQSATSKDWYFEQATVDKAIELTRYLMKKYNIPADHVIRHYDVTGKICPNPYVYNTTKHVWDAFKKAIAGENTTDGKDSMTKITGKAQATADQMVSYIKSKNPDVAQSVVDMIPLYLSEGAAENIRGDIAFAQSCLETGNFAFKGSAVTLDQNNFCGMGVTENGMKGNSFDSPQLGIRAQIQHLKAYANTAALKQECVDPRFQYVKRGSASYVEYLGIKENPKGVGWAAGAGYGEKILGILKSILNTGSSSGGSTGSGSNGNSGANSSFPDAPFSVHVHVSDLNIRTSPSSKDDSNLTGQHTGVGTFTIEEISGSWGRLKSGAGWIYLGNASFCTIGDTVKEDLGKENATSSSTVPYMIKTTCDILRIREKPSMSSQIKGRITENEGHKKKYTIIEEKDGWGRLKSGAGWICLEYTKKVS